MGKFLAILFFGLTASPGVVVVLGVVLTGRLEGGSGAACAVGWLVLVVTIVCFGARAGILEARRAERRSRNRCLACGYDLRASAGRCPECGRAAV